MQAGTCTDSIMQNSSKADLAKLREQRVNELAREDPYIARIASEIERRIREREISKYKDILSTRE
jgi:hypothetical protein